MLYILYMKKYFILALVVSSLSLSAQERVFKGSKSSPFSFKEKISSPINSESSLKILFNGLVLTAGLYIAKPHIGDPMQESWSTERPMGELAHFGDIMGQWVPNLGYMAFNHFTSESDPNSKRRRNLMFDATLYTGITTVLLKHTVGERRPNGGDRLSFPSGHTATAFAFAGVVGIEHSTPYAIAAYSMATIVGLSRINDNAHYLHDVVAGASLGLSYAYGLSELDSNPVDVTMTPLEGGVSLGMSYQFD